MAEAKTKPTDESVDAFLDRIPNEQRREDCRAVAAIMTKATQAEPVMWGAGIVGFGLAAYEYASGRTGDWPVVAFAPRKREIVLYLELAGDEVEDLLAKLGTHKNGKSCLYVKRLADVDQKVLAKLVAASVKVTKARTAT